MLLFLDKCECYLGSYTYSDIFLLKIMIINLIYIQFILIRSCPFICARRFIKAQHSAIMCSNQNDKRMLNETDFSFDVTESKADDANAFDMSLKRICGAFAMLIEDTCHVHCHAYKCFTET